MVGMRGVVLVCLRSYDRTVVDERGRTRNERPPPQPAMSRQSGVLRRGGVDSHVVAPLLHGLSLSGLLGSVSYLSLPSRFFWPLSPFPHGSFRSHSPS